MTGSVYHKSTLSPQAGHRMVRSVKASSFELSRPRASSTDATPPSHPPASPGCRPGRPDVGILGCGVCHHRLSYFPSLCLDHTVRWGKRCAECMHGDG
ncbi:hypothetical protein LZ31DRAFT_550191 [Colletotrichum somersetense]|nr:hypothetical protein LZ31DRAFT_550191 [Colletotrichum somersetense]